MNEKSIEIVKEIDAQIKAATPWSVLGSWGIRKKRALIEDGKPTLALLVKGLLHKGWVHIAYNEGRDVYEVYIKNSSGRVLASVGTVYCDELSDVIDGLVERAPGTTNEDYEHQCRMQNAI